MSAYRKLIAAVVGVLVMLAHRYLGIDLAGLEPALIDGAIALLTAIGVWAVPNDPLPEKRTP